jgi:integrase
VQRGQIFQRHGAWHLRYRVDGKQVSCKLADFSDLYRTEKSVRTLADQILSPVNQGLESGGLQTLPAFIETVYLPHAKLHRKPSTYNGYVNLYNLRIAPFVGGIRLATFRTLDGQKLLNAVAASSLLSHQTLKNVKSLLSGVFAFAKRMGAFDGVNPIESTEVPRGTPSEETHAYSNDEVQRMLEVLAGTSKVAVTIASYTGLSLGELRGLKWGDISEDTLRVQRLVWRKHVVTPKTVARQDELPLLPVVKEALDSHRKANPNTEWVFEGPYFFPLDLATYGSKHVADELMGSGVKWYGWHALRRGFATRLHEAGVQDRIIQSLMRHSSLSVTMKHYVKATNKANVEAMKKLTPQLMPPSPSSVPVSIRKRKAS